MPDEIALRQSFLITDGALRPIGDAFNNNLPNDVSSVFVGSGDPAEQDGRVLAQINFFEPDASTIVGRYFYFRIYTEAGMIILALYHGLIVSLVVLSASWWRRRCHWPMVFVFPMVWVAGEYWRMSGAIGMPLGLLAQPAYEQLWMIQVSDLGGSYVLSFAIAMVGALLADLIVERWSSEKLGKKKILAASTATAAVWMFVGSYGVYRLHQSEQTMTAGPVVTVVQNDVPTWTDGSVGMGMDPNVMVQELLAISTEASRESPPPRLVILPESPSGMPPLNREWFENPDAEKFPEYPVSINHRNWIHEWIEQHQIPIIIGSLTRYGNQTRNSALRFDPGKGQLAQSQDKVHLFPAGEFIPWEGTLLHTGLMWAIGGGREDWITPGTSREIIPLENDDHDPWRYVVAVCNEIIYPKDMGTFHPEDEDGGKPFDFVVNIANNGGFQRNHALIHNHIMLPFRAVEGRMGIARSVNTGMSGFIKPTGELYGFVTNSEGQAWTGKGAPEMELIEQATRMRQERAEELSTNPELRKEFMEMVAEIERLRAEAGISGQSTEPVFIDTRRTLYSRTGDLFGKILLGILIVGILGYLWEMVMRLRRPVA